MNQDVAPFDDRNVRLALATCIDQAQLVETTYPTGTLIANQFVPPNTFGFTPGLLWYDQDPEAAGDLIETAGFEDGLTVTLSLSDSPSDFLPDPPAIAAELQSQLSECNITATIETLSPESFEERLLAGELALHLSGWSPDFPGPIGFLNAHFTGSGNGLQFGQPSQEVVDRLEQAAGTSDRTLRTELYSQVNQMLKEQVLFVPLAHASTTVAAHADLPGIITNPVRREALSSVGPLTDTLPYTTFVYAVSSLPTSMDPSDEVDDMTFLVTTQVFDTLVEYEPATTVLTTGLAIEWSANEGADIWEFKLRPNVTFHDGTEFNADAVILNFERVWHAEHPLHIGRSGSFRYFRTLFGAFRPPESDDDPLRR
jgi:ABC-type transport system substrate-binding protein